MCMSIYATPRTVTSLEECGFYHTMDIPGFGTIEGSCAHDMRDTMESYTGNVDVAGKRVLDVGTANGLTAFYLEECGADVVALDLSKDQQWNTAKLKKEQCHMSAELLDKLNNGFWLAHGALQSSVQVLYTSIYEIPDELEPVDIAFFGSVLLHVRDPYLALESIAQHTKETIVITEMKNPIVEGPVMRFQMNADPIRNDTWWHFNPELFVEMFRTLGFTDVQVLLHHQPRKDGGENEFFSVVGHRKR